MSLLLAMTGWHVEDWRARFAALLPEMPVVVLGEPFDRRAVHYVASWKHPPGSLGGLPNLAAIFSLGAGVDFLFADEALLRAVMKIALDGADQGRRLHAGRSVGGRQDRDGVGAGPHPR